MPVLKEHLRMDSPPARFARRFERLVGLKLSHVCIVAALLAAMYIATESYSSESGYVAPLPAAAADERVR